MYAYDRTGGDHDREGCGIDAGRDAYTSLAHAMAVLADDPGKLIYFPCKQPGYMGYYPYTYHVVFCRPGLQFKRSLWKRYEGLIEEVNDTIFFVPERLFCHQWHYVIAKTLEDEDWEKKEKIHGMHTMKGYVLGVDKKLWYTNLLFLLFVI